jgi:hypothetical protein
MWQEGYAHGQADGYAQGVREAEDDMAAHWKTVGDRIRADIDKSPYVSWFNVAYVRALPVPADIGASAQRPVYEYGKAA